MAEESAALSDRQMQQIEDWFSGKGVEPRCSQCQRTQMSTFSLAAVSFITEEGTASTQRATTLLPIICDNCAHVEWFLPSQMGMDV